MRVMARITMPAGPANGAIKGSAQPSVFPRATGGWHPEAMSSASSGGQRSALMVSGLPRAPELPRFAGPFFAELNAGAPIPPVMS